MTLGALKTWLAADSARGRKTMQENRSFVFFRELANEDDGPLGSLEIPLSDGRSLAVDTGFHALGTPVYVSAPTLEPWGKSFERLMIAQDVGSAIRGPRAWRHIFRLGRRGPVALPAAPSTPARYFVLLPRKP